MGICDDRVRELESLCRAFRIRLIQMLHRVQTGHPGGSLSSTEIITALYFEKMRIDPLDPRAEGRDRFILSKGHAAPMLYIALAELGFFPREDLDHLRQLGSHLQGHPSAKTTPGVELSTGPLGLGLSAGLGMALGERMAGRDSRIYVLLGDGEIQEGIIWEAAMAAAKFRLDNCIAILDHNGVQLDGTIDEVMPLGNLKAKWTSFGWNVIEIDGHSVRQVCDALDEARNQKGKPTIIMANTVKGKGVPFMEGKSAWHGKPISPEECATAISALEGGNHGS